jgi:hypothetical protein
MEQVATKGNITEMPPTLNNLCSDRANLTFLVVGLARNCTKHLKSDVIRLKSAINQPKELHWLLIESDSSDDTVAELGNLAKEVENFKYLSLGNLRHNMPKRTERISHCRNKYIEQILNDETYHYIDYVVVADFDGLNTLISSTAFDSCWEQADWDMCAANQDAPYYDIWALRHKEWSPNDCWSQYDFLNQYTANKNRVQNLYNCVYARMLRIPLNSEWIRVDSAFGGLAIYKKDMFVLGKYHGINEAGNELCEHVHFHQQLTQQGARLFINPKFINAGYNEHTEPLLLRNVLKRKLESVKEFAAAALNPKRVIRKLRRLF